MDAVTREGYAPCKVARGTLREALRQLEQEGLLSAGPRGRLSVRHLDAKEIRDIFAVRAALESLAARTLCELPDRVQLTASLRAAIESMAAAQGGLEGGSNPTSSSTRRCAA